MDSVQGRLGKVVFVRFAEGEDLLEAVTKTVEKAGFSAGFFYVIGTLKNAKMGFFREGKYETIEMNEPLEIVSCIGNISLKENKPFPHAHIAVSDEKGRVSGGHVMQGCIIGVTGELVLIEAVGIKLLRQFDEKTKLSLLTFSKSLARSRSRKKHFV